MSRRDEGNLNAINVSVAIVIGGVTLYLIISGIERLKLDRELKSISKYAQVESEKTKSIFQNKYESMNRKLILELNETRKENRALRAEILRIRQKFELPLSLEDKKANIEWSNNK